MSLIAEFPYSYTAGGKARGRRTPDKHVIVDTIPVSIERVDPDEAPVAFRAKPPGKWPLGIQLRAHRGRPMRRLPGPDGALFSYGSAPAVTEANLDKTFERCARGQAFVWHGYPVAIEGCGNAGALPRHDDHGLRDIEWTDRDERRAAAVAAFAHVISVNGEIWVEAPEPYLSLTEKPTTHGPRPELVVEPDHDKAGYACFRVDRLDDARSFACQLVGGDMDALAPDWTIEDDGLIDWDLEDRLLSAKGLVSELYARPMVLRDMPAEFLSGYALLRDLTHRQGGPVASDLATLQAGLRRMLDALEAQPSPIRPLCWGDVHRKVDLSVWRIEQIDRPRETDDAALAHGLS